jgi:hypothetical protein
MTEPPKHKRRWFQFSLRALLVAATIVAVQCAVCFPMLREWESYDGNPDFDELIKVISNGAGMTPESLAKAERKYAKEQAHRGRPRGAIRTHGGRRAAR